MEDQQYLIADDVLVTFPELLFSKTVGAKLLVLDVTLRRLETPFAARTQRENYSALIDDAIAAGSLAVVKIDDVFPRRYNFNRTTAEGSFEDTLLVSVADAIRAILVTDSSRERRIAESWPVEVISSADLKERLTKAPLGERVVAFIKGVRRGAWLDALALAANLATFVAFYSVLPKSIAGLLRLRSPWFTVILVASCGVAAFMFRQKWRLYYGFLEVLVGLGGAWNAGDFRASWSVAFTLQLFGSIYIVVRGIDNVTTGWPSSNLRWMWRRRVWGRTVRAAQAPSESL